MKFYVQCLFNLFPNVIVCNQHAFIFNHEEHIFLPFSKYLMQPLIWGKTIQNGLTISSSLQSIKYLKPSSLCLNLSDITIWSTFINLDQLVV